MNKLNNKFFIYILVSVGILFYLGLLVFEEKLGLQKVLLNIPKACGFSFIFFLAFEKWLWKWKPFSFFVPYPYLGGTWQGKLKSSYVFEDGSTPDQIDITLVITQTLFSVSCEMYTEESNSSSVNGTIVNSDAGKMKTLIYTYGNETNASVKHRSNSHQGTAKLRITNKGKSLKGNYWTERGTIGEMELSHVSTGYADDYIPIEITENS